MAVLNPLVHVKKFLPHNVIFQHLFSKAVVLKTKNLRVRDKKKSTRKEMVEEIMIVGEELRR